MTTPGRPTSPQISSRGSFPNPVDIQNEHPPSSAVSSRMTDIDESEDGDGQQASSGRVLGQTGPVGEPGLPPSRPSSIATGQSSKRRTWGQAPPSRRGHVPAFGPGSVAGSIGTRPGTASSRTHVPSLTANAFFRPMSSQRLQAQRGQRPPSLVIAQSSLRRESGSEAARSSYRLSDSTSIPPFGLTPDHDHVPPASRGTDVTADIPDRTTANTSPTGAETVRSQQESITPLQGFHKRPTHLDLNKQSKGVSNSGVPTPGKSPRSFRSSFIIPSRGAASVSNRPQGQGHEKLSSAASSPRMTRDERKEDVKKELGKNHEYFTGNTVFCWGGRLQNARDRPINIFTGLLIVLPTALFFAYSYVEPSAYVKMEF